MNPEIKEQWVRALRSGEYEQGEGFLHTKHEGSERIEFCCLGVLCDLAVKAGVIPTPYESPSGTRTYGSDVDQNNPQSIINMHEATYTVLPRSVYQWAGLPDIDPEFEWEPEDNAETGIEVSTFSETLSGANDSGHTFEEIATIIERKF